MAKTKSKTPAKRDVPERDELVGIVTKFIDMLSAGKMGGASHACLSIDFARGTLRVDADAG